MLVDDGVGVESEERVNGGGGGTGQLAAYLELRNAKRDASQYTDAGCTICDASLPTTRAAVRAYLARHPGPHRAVVESTSNWYWPRLIPTPDIQRLVWIPGIGKIVAFTLVLEVDDIHRFPSVKDFVSYCRRVPGAGNSGGKSRHKRTKDGNRYLTIAFSHAAVRAIQYCPEMRAFYQRLARRKPRPVARALVAKELARIVYVVLTREEPCNHTFKGQSLSTTKATQWPRLASPPV